MKCIIECSKCGGGFVADLYKIHTQGNPLGPVYEYRTECLNCRIGISCYISEIEETPKL